MDRAETAAKSIVETLINGAKMHYHTNQPLGEYDFDLEYPDGMKVPFEVTSAADQDIAETQAAILKPRSGGGPFVSRGGCAHDWYVHPLPSAKINTVRTHVASYLVAIEAEGREKFDAFTDATESPAVFAIFQELKIECGEVVSWKPPGCIGIALPGEGGLVDPVLVNEVVETEALKADNRRKLSAAAGAEKHLFVYLDGTSKYIVWASARGMPPATGPNLPDEITHVWMAAWVKDDDEEWHTVWRAQHGSSWTHDRVAKNGM